jgi:hypothetical protein
MKRLRASHVDFVSGQKGRVRLKRHSLQLVCIDHGFSFPLLFRVLHP